MDIEAGVGGAGSESAPEARPEMKMEYVLTFHVPVLPKYHPGVLP